MKAQGSLEYLLILAAILAIAVVTVVIANSMLNPAQASASVQDDKYIAGLAGYELIDYTVTVDFETDDTAWATAPKRLKKNNILMDTLLSGERQPRCLSSDLPEFASRETYLAAWEADNWNPKVKFTLSGGIDAIEVSKWAPSENATHYMTRLIKYGSPGVFCEYHLWECDAGEVYAFADLSGRCLS